MRKRVNKLIALFLTVSLSTTSLVYAEDVAEISDVEVTTEESAEASSEAADEEVNITAVENSVTAQFCNADSLVYDTDLSLTAAETAAVLSQTADELNELTADEDYVSNEAVFTTDSEETANEVAAEYGAELESYSDGVAVLKFDKNVADVFSEAGESLSSNVLLHPNYISNFDDSASEIVIEPEELDFSSMPKATTASSVSASHSDPYLSKQWFLDAISVNDAWSVTKGSGAKVAILDTGCDVSHEDLAANIAETWSVVKNSTDVTDSIGHGTHCAGTVAAALDNSKGGAGVAPESKLYIIQIASGESITFSNIIKGINKAAEWDVDVASMSFGGYNYSSSAAALMQNAINNLYNNGTVVVAAAGNEHVGYYSYPASLGNVISVASAGYGMYASHTIEGHTYSPSDPELAYYSNYGDTVDIIAPGGSATGNGYSYVDNLSTVPSSYNSVSSGFVSTGYAYMAGTSMACPVAAGVAALIYSANSDLISKNTAASSGAVEEKLLASSDGKTYSNVTYNTSVDTGCLNALTAVTGSASSSPIMIKRKDGTILGDNTYVFIEKGTSEKLRLVDASGKKLSSSETKGGSWESSDSSNFSIKNGKVKVSKNATAGEPVTVKFTCNGKTVRINFMAINKVKKIVYRKSSKKLGKNYSTSATVNSSIDLSSLSNIVGSSVYAITASKKYGSYLLLSGYSMDSIGYNVTANKKTSEMISGMTFTPTKAGNYKLKFVINDGSKKSFTVTFKVS